MFRWTIFGIVVTFPRVVSTTLLTFGALTLTPRSPRSRWKYRFLIPSRAPKTAAFRPVPRWSSLRFASSRSTSATRPAVAAFLRSNSSIVPALCLAIPFTSDDEERDEGDHEHDETVPEPVRYLPGVEHSRQDAILQAVHNDRDEERDLHVVDDRGQVVREGTRTREGAYRSGPQRLTRLEHLRKERHVQDPDRHEEHHERDVDDGDVRGHRDPALVFRELILLRVVADHRQDVGDGAPRVGGLDDDCDDPLDHGGLHPLGEQAEGFRRGDAPG